MAAKFQSIQRIHSRRARHPLLSEDQFTHHLAEKALLTPGVTDYTLRQLANALARFARQGQGVEVAHLGTFFPRTQSDGSLTFTVRLGGHLQYCLNDPDYGFILAS